MLSKDITPETFKNKMNQRNSDHVHYQEKEELKQMSNSDISPHYKARDSLMNAKFQGDENNLRALMKKNIRKMMQSNLEKTK